MKTTLRAVPYFVFLTLLWARTSIWIDEATGGFWAAYLGGGALAIAITVLLRILIRDFALRMRVRSRMREISRPRPAGATPADNRRRLNLVLDSQMRRVGEVDSWPFSDGQTQAARKMWS